MSGAGHHWWIEESCCQSSPTWARCQRRQGLGGRRRADQQREVSAGVGGDGLAVALAGQERRQFIGDELVIGRSLERQEGLKEQLHIVGPVGAMVAPGEVEAEGGRVLQPGGPQAEEMGAADVEQLPGGVGVEVALFEGGQGLLEERQGNALEKLVFCKEPWDAGESILRCRAGEKFSLILFPPRQELRENVLTFLKRPV